MLDGGWLWGPSSFYSNPESMLHVGSSVSFLEPPIVYLGLLDVFSEMEVAAVARSLYNKVNEVCKRWNKDLPKLFRNKHSYETYVYAIKNTRRKMEDKHIIQPEFNSLYGFPQVTRIAKYCLIFWCSKDASSYCTASPINY